MASSAFASILALAIGGDAAWYNNATAGRRLCGVACQAARRVGVIPGLSRASWTPAASAPSPAASSPPPKHRTMLSTSLTPVAASREEEIAQQQRLLKCRPLMDSKSPGAFTKCAREVASTPETFALHYRQKHACAHLDHCNGRGECFLGRCFCAPHRFGDRCEQMTPKTPACSLLSDACFRSRANGRARVSLERWQRASWAEESWWSSQSVTSNERSDHGDAMKAAFSSYRRVPSRLGHVLELGCGPYTQLRELLAVRGRGWSVDSVTLADPILVFESKHRNSAFTSGKFVDRAGVPYPTTLHQVGAEAVGSLYHDAFDTVIMMNVLEHVASAYEVLETIYNATKPGGVVVLWEPMYSPAWAGWKERGDELLLDMSLPLSLHVKEPDWGDVRVRDTIRSRAFDMMAHPIRVDPSVFAFFASKFDKLDYRVGDGRRGDSSIMLVGRKREPSAMPWV